MKLNPNADLVRRQRGGNPMKETIIAESKHYRLTTKATYDRYTYQNSYVDDWTVNNGTLSAQGVETVLRRDFLDRDLNPDSGVTLTPEGESMRLAMVAFREAENARQKAAADAKREAERKAAETRARVRADVESQAKALKLKRHPVTLANMKKEPYLTILDAMCARGLALLRDPHGKGYQVCHVASGCRLSSGDTKTDAKIRMARYLTLPTDWTADADTVTADPRVHALYRATLTDLFAEVPQ